MVIPADARKDYSIKTGDKLLVMGDLETGLWITTFEIMGRMPAAAELFRVIASTMKDQTERKGE